MRAELQAVVADIRQRVKSVGGAFADVVSSKRAEANGAGEGSLCTHGAAAVASFKRAGAVDLPERCGELVFRAMASHTETSAPPLASAIVWLRSACVAESARAAMPAPDGSNERRPEGQTSVRRRTDIGGGV